MAIAHVASVGAASTNQISATTGAIDTTAATVIEFCIWWYSGGGATLPVITDSKGNTYTLIATYHGSGANAGAEISHLKCEAPTVGTGHTFSAGVGGSAFTYPAIAVIALSGTLTSGALDVETGLGNSTINGSTVKPGSLTANQDNSAYVTFGSCGVGGGSDTIDLSYTITVDVAAVPSNGAGIAGAYFIQGAAAARDPQWSNGSDYRGATHSVYKPAAVASASSPFNLGARTLRPYTRMRRF